MNFEDIISNFSTESTLSEDLVNLILHNEEIRSSTVKYLRHNQNRYFAQSLLGWVVDKRKNQDYETGAIENIMFSCYLVGLHKNVEDSILLWKAKTVDFDTYCGVDVQLVVFSGIDKTIAFLNTLNTEEANKAIEYLKKCRDAGDFNNIEIYFSDKQQPWWI